MAKDPAFLFYPGDYLRDTQTLSEKTQVAYDRIMCEHMRNICITKQQLKFFTKRLSEDEIEELMFVLTEVDDCFQIEWVAESIVKRRAYSESRRANRKKKTQKDMNNISKTYDKHMENENENENINKREDEKKAFELFWNEYHRITKTLKKEKDPAFKYWKKLTKVEKTDAVFNIKLYYDSIVNKEYIKKAYTYLRDKSFDNEFEVKKPIEDKPFMNGQFDTV